jgi:SNF2-related domain/Family of unknown function (DUF6011)/Helicase conserved C-terminal domain
MSIRIVKDGDRWIARFAFSFELKDIVKAAGFRFSPTEKLWFTRDQMIAAKLDPELAAAAVSKANADIEASRAIDAAINVPAPEGLAYLPYQRGGIFYTMQRQSTLIADDMGLGKTIQALGAINADPTVKSVLVISPASLKLNWKREAEKWLVRPMTVEVTNGGFPNADMVIVNYDVLVKFRDQIMARHWDLLIVDEAHYAKNPKAQRTKMLFGSKKDGMSAIQAGRRIFLTGTPILNKPVELWTLVQALDPEDLGRNFHRFTVRYCAAYKHRFGWDRNGASNLDELQTRLRGKFMVRRLKSEVLVDLPAKRRQVIDIAPNGATSVIDRENALNQRKLDAIRAVAEAEASGNKAAYDSAVANLKEAESVAFAEISALRHEVAVAKIPAVIEHVEMCLENEGKIVVFAHHLDVIEALMAAFPGSAMVSGLEPNLAKRDAAVARFQNDPACRVFIGGIKAAGVGLTLTAASHVVFAELDWTPGGVTQAEDRCHRIGQKNMVLVQHLVFDGSLDSRIAKIIVDKQNVIDAALDAGTAPVRVEPVYVPAAPVPPPVAPPARPTPGLPPRTPDGQPDLTLIREMFDAARAESRTGKLMFRAGQISLSLAPSYGRNPGAVYVKRGEDYLGKIVGITYQGKPCPELAIIALDPYAAATAHGLLTKQCGCCGKTLTDPVSVARGIGPDCAAKWGFV